MLLLGCYHRTMFTQGTIFFSDTKNLIEAKPHCTISFIVLICRVGLKGVMAQTADNVWLLTLPDDLLFTPWFQQSSGYSIFSVLCNVCRSLFVLMSLFLLAIALSVVVRFTANRTSGVIVSVHASCAVDPVFEPRSGQTKDYSIGIYCFYAKHAVIRRKSKDWSAWNQNNVPECGDMSIRGPFFH